MIIPKAVPKGRPFDILFHYIQGKTVSSFELNDDAMSFYPLSLRVGHNKKKRKFWGKKLSVLKNCAISDCFYVLGTQIKTHLSNDDK